MADTAALQKAAVRGDEGPHQGRRFLGADEGRPVRLRLVLQDRRRAAALFRTPRDGGDGGDHPRRRRRGRRQALFPHRRRRPFARPPQAAVGLSTTRARNSTRCASATSRPATISPTTSPTPAARGVWNADNRRLLLHPARRQPPAVEDLLTTRSARDAREDRLVYEETDPGFFMNVGGTPLQRLDLHRHQRSRDLGIPAASRPTIRTAEPKLVAARETGLQYDLEEGGDVFFILTNADGAKDFKIMTAPAADPRARELDGTGAARAGPADPVGAVASRISWSGWSARTACRASSCATARPARST